MVKRDYYEVLGVSRDAGTDQIKNSYRKLALKYHPDRNKSPDAEERFKEISEAYGVLSSEEKRRLYDSYGHAGIEGRYTSDEIFRGADLQEILREMGFGFGGFQSIFETFFGGTGRGRGGQSAGQHLMHDVELTLSQAATGVKMEIEVPRRVHCSECNGSGASPGSTKRSCPTCQGTGQVQHVQSSGFARFIRVETCSTCRGKGTFIDRPCASCNGSGLGRKKERISVQIPAGVDEASRIRIRGYGDVSPNGGPPGDLFIQTHMIADPRFSRDGEDLIHEAAINFPRAALGGEVDVPTLDGPARLKIPPGTQSGVVFRLKGKGFPSLDGYGRGDELVRVTVLTPTKLTPKERELMLLMAKEMGEEPPKRRSIFK